MSPKLLRTGDRTEIIPGFRFTVRFTTVLAVLTTEDRHSIWREFIGMHWHGEELFEVVPVKGDPLRTLEAFVTQIDRNG